MELPENKPKAEDGGLLGEPPRFEWPQNKNPLIFLFRHFGKLSFYIVLFLVIAIFTVFNIDAHSDLGTFIFLLLFGPFFISLGRLSLKQKSGAYKFAGVGTILAYILIVLFEILRRFFHFSLNF